MPLHELLRCPVGARRNVCEFDRSYFRNIDTEPKAYWLGFLMADGCVSDRARSGALQLHVHLQKSDKGHLQKFHDAIGSSNKIHDCQASVRSSHSSDFLCNDLIRWGCTPRKSLTLEYPAGMPCEMDGHFIRGYFDGDGSASVVGRRLFLHFVGTPKFLSAILDRIGLPEKKLTIRGPIGHLSIASRSACRMFADMAYSGASVWLERKRSKVEAGLRMPSGRMYSSGAFYDRSADAGNY